MTMGRETEMSDRAVQIIEKAIQEFEPNWVFALFSGGHDSLTSSYIASLASKFNGCVHINTGIGIPATRQFVIETCNEHSWPVLEYKAIENTKANGSPNPMDYEAICIREGFPAPFGHSIMYRRLKQYQIERLCREHQGRVLLVSGERQQESSRRMRIKSAFGRKGNHAFVAPIFDWSKPECSELLSSAGFKRNPVVLKLGRSGECLCGCFSEKGELSAVEFACPATANRIRTIEAKVRAAGFPWGWEEGPPKWWIEKKRGQTFMLGYDIEPTPSVEEHLCTSCKWRAL